MSTFPIIVLDGPDGSGKTTFAELLCKEYGFRYRHLTYRWKDKMFYYHWAAMEECLRDAETTPVVLDRWWPTELIYANVFRGGSKWPLAKRMFDRVALKHGFTYVFCVPSDEEKYYARFEALKETGREMYTSMRGIYEGYIELFNQYRTRLDMVYYDLDTHGQDLTGYVQWLLDISQQVRDPLVSFDRLDRRFAGNVTTPKIMFVGDESNSKMRRQVWPFFEYGNSSLWITNALEQVDIPEDDLCWINIHHNNKIQDDLFRMLVNNTTTLSTVVALGHNASGSLNKIGMEHTLIKHPQWNRRFAPLDFREYKALSDKIK